MMDIAAKYQRQLLDQRSRYTTKRQSVLVGRELAARREEIAQALVQWQGLMTTQQQMSLQPDLAKTDDAIKRLQIKQQGEQFSADLGHRNRALDQAGSQFGQTLGLRPI